MTVVPLPDTPDAVTAKLNPAYLALSRLRRSRFTSAVDICSSILAITPLDRAVWTIKTHALTAAAYVDDTDLEEEGIAEMLLDENAISKTPRPGTSVKRPVTGAASEGNGARPMTGSGRPLSGFVRPSTQSRARVDTASLSVESAFKGLRPGTSRPMTVAGRSVRLGTASISSEVGGEFIMVERLNLQKFASKPAEAKALVDYLIYVLGNYSAALELASHATQLNGFNDWFWKARLGKCYYKLGMYRDAEQQFTSAIKQQPDTVSNILEWAKIHARLDQPNTVKEAITGYLEQPRYSGDVSLLVTLARLHDSLGDESAALELYKRILILDATHMESIACLAAYHFYHEPTELALRYYRRCVQMGLNTAAVWNNLGLCCFYSAQYDTCLACFDRALQLASPDELADVWYNIGMVNVGIGDCQLAALAWKTAIAVQPTHAEALNNLGLLELRLNHSDQSRHHFLSSQQAGPHLYEPFYNAALQAWKVGDVQATLTDLNKALALQPNQHECKELAGMVKKALNST